MFGKTDFPLHARVNLGCGPIEPPGWVNVDNSNRAKLASRLHFLDSTLVRLGVLAPTEFGPQTTIIDVTRSLPFPDDSVGAFYSGEMLEHLKLPEATHLLAECHRCLEPGGHLRIVVPDIHHFWRSYLDAVDEQLARPREQWDDERIRALVHEFFRDICVERPWLGSMGHFHKWGYDEVQLVLAMERAGFAEVARREPHESAIPGIEEVEVRGGDFLIVEGRKPA